MSKSTCSFPECAKAVFGHGLCSGHYNQRYRGKTLKPLKNLSLSTEERFWEKVNKTSACWEWTAARNENGYGVFNSGHDGKRSHLAHRYAYELEYGSIRDGLVLDHLCKNPPCVRASHLEQVTQGTNVLRGSGFAAVNANKTHCVRGHEFTPENTRTSRNGWRDCRLCGKEKAQSWRDARKQK